MILNSLSPNAYRINNQTICLMSSRIIFNLGYILTHNFIKCTYTKNKLIIQFTVFTKDSFTRPNNSNKFLLEIPRDDIGFVEIDIREKKDSDTCEEIDYEIIDEMDKITIMMKHPKNIRVNF